MENKKIGEGFATLQQIKKLYAVIRNAGMEPKEYVEELKKETGFDSLRQFTKREISRKIDELENSERKEVIEEKKGNIEEKKPEVAKELENSLNEIDTTFCACIEKASKTISREFSDNKAKDIQDMIILETAKLYFGEVRKGAERG